jgi:hypothetical protein
MPKTPRLVLLIAGLALSVLLGCSEAPPRAAPQGEQAYNDDPGNTSLRDRTLNQGESARMSY